MWEQSSGGGEDGRDQGLVRRLMVWFPSEEGPSDSHIASFYCPKAPQGCTPGLNTQLEASFPISHAVRFASRPFVSEPHIGAGSLGKSDVHTPRQPGFWAVPVICAPGTQE